MVRDNLGVDGDGFDLQQTDGLVVGGLVVVGLVTVGLVHLHMLVDDGLDVGVVGLVLVMLRLVDLVVVVLVGLLVLVVDGKVSQPQLATTWRGVAAALPQATNEKVPIA